MIRYGSKALFADGSNELGKSRQIHYDDAAIDSLLNRDQVVDQDSSSDDEEEDGSLKAFKVANFEYIDEEGLAAEEEASVTPAGTTGSIVPGEEVDLDSLEDVSSDNEDDDDEAELTDTDIASTGVAAVKGPYPKRARVTSEPIPLMEGEGRSFRVLGFNQKQRAIFVQTLMRFGVGDFDWADFTPLLKQKTYEEIRDYGRLFLSHIAEEITDSPTFSDGVPKEGLKVQKVLVRIASVLLISNKVRSLSLEDSVLFEDDIVRRYPGLKGGRVWKEYHDGLLLGAVLKHGYGRWRAIVDDKNLQIQEVIYQELNLPCVTVPVPKAPQVQNAGSSQSQNCLNSEYAEAPGYQVKRAHNKNDFGAVGAHSAADAAVPAQNFQDHSVPCNFKEIQTRLDNYKEIQRRLVEFVKKRMLLLEKGLNAELQKETFGDGSNMEPDETQNRVTDVTNQISGESDGQMIDTST